MPIALHLLLKKKCNNQGDFQLFKALKMQFLGSCNYNIKLTN